MDTKERAATYRRHAAEARALAQSVTDANGKESLLSIAASYERLAVLTERPGRDPGDQNSN